MPEKKKLIEVALPLQAINEASAREKSIRHGHPSTLHLWWARRPLAAARAVIFAQMVDDPSSRPELFPTKEAQEKERQRLFGLLEALVLWENTTNEEVLGRARAEIQKSWRRTCADNQNHPRAAELFNPEKLPTFHDPFAGGGALPLEAQRLGLESWASDLNPVAVLINKAMIEIPPLFAGQPPMNPEARKNEQPFITESKGAKGLAEDVRYYGKWMRDEAEKRIGHLYPKVEITPEMVKERPDLKQYEGKELTVIAWLWARTVKSPNPAFADVEVPLASTFMLSTKKGKEAWVEPVIEDGDYRFTVKVGKPKNPQAAKNGTKLSRGANFKCLMSGVPISGDYIKAEGKAGRMGAKLMAIVAEGQRERIYLCPVNEHILSLAKIIPTWKPELKVPNPCHDVDRLPMYGMPTWGDAFTPRQLVALTTFSDLIAETMEQVRGDYAVAELKDIPSLCEKDNRPLRDGGTGVTAYAEAVATNLAFGISKIANVGSKITSWMSDRGAFRETFSRQAIPMVWDYAESNPFSDVGGSFSTILEKVALSVEWLPASVLSTAQQGNAIDQFLSKDKVISTDPPYYDNIGYADLSDFFYVWLRRSLRSIYPDLFATMSTPKAEELVASPYRHGNRQKAEVFFLEGMTRAMKGLAQQSHPAFPITIYYAFKQSERNEDGGDSSTGWETFLDAVNNAGLAVTGTWPVRTEGAGRIIAKDTNALASSIVLVCRKRHEDSPSTTRKDFLSALKKELHPALRLLQSGNIAPVDLAQAAIGPGMGVYTRYSKVLDAQGNPLSVREALSLINEVLDETLAEREGEFDPESRWALAWFDQFAFGEGEFGVAETLSKAKNTSVQALDQAGIVESRRGKVRLLPPKELSADWDPAKDSRFTAWEGVHHLIRVLESQGETGAAELAAKLGSRAEGARDLAYRLYTLCERKKRAAEALAYNGLVQSWPEIMRLSLGTAREDRQGRLDLERED